MHKKQLLILSFLLMVVPFLQARADEYVDTIKIFKQAGESGEFFKSAYGYAVFPTIGKGGFIVAGAFGKGRVYTNGHYVGNTSMTQLTAGFQIGAEAYSQIIFFEDKSAFEQFTGGNFEFSAQARAVAITAGASMAATTTGSSVGMSGGAHDARTAGSYRKGMAVFTVARGGIMFEASLGGQKFTYSPRM
jgi:lipid-binding SYLF domain-containing protein